MDAAATRCLKITEKVSFNIYVYILSGQKSSLKMLNLACDQTVLPDRSILKGQKLVKNAKIKKKFKWDTLSNFQTMCAGAMMSLIT